MGQAAIARATRSSLNAQRSSADPPPRAGDDRRPRPGTLAIARSAWMMSGAAPSPCTRAGRITRCAFGWRRPRTLMMSLQRGAVERGDDADLSRKRRERPLAPGLEQPLRLELLLQLIECELQRAKAVRLHVLADDLVFPLGCVDAELSTRDHVQSVLRLEAEVAQRRPEHDRFDLCVAVLEGEIHVPRVPDAAIGDLPFDPHLSQLLLEQLRGSWTSAERR